MGAVVCNTPLPRPHGSLTIALATVSPAGRRSFNVTGLSATVFTAGLVIVMVRVVVAFNGMVVGLNTLATVGGATTVRFAVAVLPVPPLVELTAPVVFVY